MRALALIALTGCEVLFPLQDPGPADATEELDRPQGTLRVVEPPVVAGDVASIELSVVGRADAGVAYQLDSEPGVFETEGGMLQLTEEVAAGVGRATALLSWQSPLSCSVATVHASLGYDQTIDLGNQAALDIPVHRRIGPSDLPSMVGPLPTNAIVAMPIQVDALGCIPISLSVAVLESADTTGQIGIYNDVGLGPAELQAVAPLPPTSLAEETVLEVPISLGDPLPPGTYWVAVITSGGMVLDAEGSGPALVVNGTTDTLPEAFPNALALASTVRFGITVAPR